MTLESMAYLVFGFLAGTACTLGVVFWWALSNGNGEDGQL